MTHQAPDVAGSLRARRRLAGAQQHGHRSAGGGIVDMDRQKAALTGPTSTIRRMRLKDPDFISVEI